MPGRFGILLLGGLLVVLPGAARGQAAPPPGPGAPGGGEDPVEEVEDVEVVQEDPRWDPSQVVQMDRAVNLMWARTVRRMALVLVVDHRTFSPAFNKDTWHDLFGFDGGGLRVGLGLRFGILDGLDVGIYRVSNATDAFDTYQFDAKWCFLREDRHHLDVAIRGGLSWFSQRNARDAVGGFGQLLVSRTLWKRLTLGTGLMFHSDSSSDVKSTADTDWSLAVPGAVEVRILPWLSWNVEAAFRVAGYGAKWPSFSSAVKFLTPRHVFALVLSNTQYVGADGVVANSSRDYRKLIVGFQVVREWGLGRH
ncbi:hypothetical protein KBD49_12175 [Myxococcota bacterium]|nr:hypothetical protein [Myxococcota bacterium]